MRTVIICIAMWIFWYLAFAFVLAELNPIAWSKYQRSFYVIWVTFLNIMTVTYPGYNKS